VVLLTVFSIFGAAAPQIAMVPLVTIIAFTALKDGIEDYRRASLDNQVNNSAATKLENWKNVNRPRDSRNWLERLFNIRPAPDKVSKGVQKLRQKAVLKLPDAPLTRERGSTQEGGAAMSMDSGRGDMSTIRSLDDIYSVSDAEGTRSLSMDHTYPPNSHGGLNRAGPDYTIPTSAADPPYPSSTSNHHTSTGVIDMRRPSTGSARWERTLWKKLEVGDLVLLRDNEQVPADIIVLSTSDADGLCYVETKNLDGETNLKVKHALKATCSITSVEDLERAAFSVDSEPPHANLYAYAGVLKYGVGSTTPDTEDGLSPAEKLEPITINELLLRGCTVRNTNWIIALVAFTGADTKIMLNGGNTPSKRSKIEKETNFNVLMNFCILIIMCLVTAVASGWYEWRSDTSADFFEVGAEPSRNSDVNALVTFV
jgi:phospholipid-translocating ATPase